MVEFISRVVAVTNVKGVILSGGVNSIMKSKGCHPERGRTSESKDPLLFYPRITSPRAG